MAGIFDLNSFINTNSNQTPINLTPNAPDPITEQRLQQAKQAGYNDRAAEHQGISQNYSGFQPQTLTEQTAYAEGSNQYDSDVNANRSIGQMTEDTLAGVGTGAASALGSALGVAEGIFEGALNPYATVGETVSRNLSTVQGITDSITGLQSDELQARRQAQATRANIQEQLDQAQYEQDLANGMGETQAGIRKFGKDLARYFSTQDASTLADATAQGVGSILGTVATGGVTAGARIGAGAVSKFAGKLASGQLGRNVTNTALKNVGEKAVENVAKKGIFGSTKLRDAALMGYTEATGNMLGTNTEVMNTPIEELRAVPEFNKLVQNYVANGYDLVSAEDQVRTDLAGSAAIRTGAYSLPAAIGAGSLATWAMHPFSRIGAKAGTNPLTMKGRVGAVAGNMSSEGTEEGLQGIFGTAAGNLAAQQTYDPNRGIFDDVGYNLAEGATAGALSAGALRSPQLAGGILPKLSFRRANSKKGTGVSAQDTLDMLSNEDNAFKQARETMQNSPVMQEIRTKAAANAQAAQQSQANPNQAVTQPNPNVNTALNSTGSADTNPNPANIANQVSRGINGSLYSGLSTDESDLIFGDDQKAKDLAKNHNNKVDIAFDLAGLIKADKDADEMTQLRRGMAINQILQTVGSVQNTNNKSVNAYDPDLQANFERGRTPEQIAEKNQAEAVVQDPAVAKVLAEANNIVFKDPKAVKVFTASVLRNSVKTAQASPKMKSDAWVAMSLALNSDPVNQNTDTLKGLAEIAHKFGWGDIENNLNSVLKTKEILTNYKSNLSKSAINSARQRFNKSSKAVRNNLLLVDSNSRKSVYSYLQDFHSGVSQGNFLNAAQSLRELKKLAINQRNKAEAMEQYNKINKYDYASSGKVLAKEIKSVPWMQLNSKSRNFQPAEITAATRKVSPMSLYDEADTLDAICDNLQHIIPQDYKSFNDDAYLRNYYKLNPATTKYDPARFGMDNQVSSKLDTLIKENNSADNDVDADNTQSTVAVEPKAQASAAVSATNSGNTFSIPQTTQTVANQPKVDSSGSNTVATPVTQKVKPTATNPVSSNPAASQQTQSVATTIPDLTTQSTVKMQATKPVETPTKTTQVNTTQTQTANFKFDTMQTATEPETAKAKVDGSTQSVADLLYGERTKLIEPTKENLEVFNQNRESINSFYKTQQERLNRLFKVRAEDYHYAAHPVDDLISKVSSKDVDPKLKPYAKALLKDFSKDDPQSFYSKYRNALTKAIKEQLLGFTTGKTVNPLWNQDKTINIPALNRYLSMQSGGMLHLLDLGFTQNGQLKFAPNERMLQLMALSAYSFMRSIPTLNAQLSEFAEDDSDRPHNAPTGAIESFTAQQLLDNIIKHYFNLRVDKDAPTNSVYPIQAAINNTIRIALNSTEFKSETKQPFLTITRVNTVLTEEIDQFGETHDISPSEVKGKTRSAKTRLNYYFSVAPEVLESLTVPTEAIDAFLNLKEKQTYVVNEEVTDIPNTVRNTDMPLKQRQKTFLKEINNLDYRVDPKMALLYTDLGTKDNINRIKGQYYSEQELNSMVPQQRAAVDGRSLGDSLAYQRFLTIMNSVRAVQETDGAVKKRLSDLPIHFKFGMTKVNRIQGDGFDPVSNKLLREAFLPTVDTLDVSGIVDLVQRKHPDGAEQLSEPEKFMMIALGQAFGLKIHKNKLGNIANFVINSVNDFEHKLKQADPAAYQYLLDLHQRSKTFNESGYPDTYRYQGKAVDMAKIAASIHQAQIDSGIDDTRLATHALVEMMSWKSATPEELKAWNTSVYLETDGITNGVCNSTLLLNSNVDENLIDILSRCGIQLGRSVTYSDHIKEQQLGSHPERANDTYETVSSKLRELFPERIRMLIGNPAKTYFGKTKTKQQLANDVAVNKAQIISTLAFMSFFSPDLGKTSVFHEVFDGSLSDSDVIQDEIIRTFLNTGLEFSRGFAKSPTTQVNYNAGMKAISRTILDNSMSGLYGRLSKALVRIEKNPTLPWHEALGLNNEMEFSNFRSVIYGVFNQELNVFNDAGDLAVYTKKPQQQDTQQAVDPISGLLLLPADKSRIKALQNLSEISHGSEYFQHALKNVKNTFGDALYGSILSSVSQGVIDTTGSMAQASNFIAKFLNSVNTQLLEQYKQELFDKHTQLTETEDVELKQIADAQARENRRKELVKEKLVAQGMLSTVTAKTYLPTRAEMSDFDRYAKEHGSALNRFSYKYSNVLNEKSKIAASKRKNDSYNRSVGTTLGTLKIEGKLEHLPAKANCFQYAHPEERFLAPGVSLTPNTTISQGDGAMMQELINSWNTLVGGDVPKRILDVFDGLHVRMTDAAKIIKAVNTAQFRTATSNPIQSIVDFVEQSDLIKSFGQYLDRLVKEDPTAAEEFIKNVTVLDPGNLKQAYNSDDTTVNAGKAKADVSNFFMTLKDKAQRISAVQEALRALPATLGQMSNGDIADVMQTNTNENVGKYLLGDTDYDRKFIVSFLRYYSNRVFESLNKGEEELPKDLLNFDVYYADYYSSGFVQNNGEFISNPETEGLTVTTLNNSDWSLNTLVDKSIEEYESLNKDSHNSNPAKGLKALKPFLKASFHKRLGNVPIVTGSRDKLKQYALNKNIALPESFVDPKSQAEAVTLSEPGIIFIASDMTDAKTNSPFDTQKSRVTLLHELVHIGTLKLLRDYAVNPDAYKGTQEEAVIKNLQTLMKYFEVKITPNFVNQVNQALASQQDKSSPVYKELTNALNRINGLTGILQEQTTGDPDRIKALSEFIAYMSTNFIFNNDKDTKAYKGFLRNVSLDAQTKALLSSRLLEVFGKYLTKLKNAIVRLFFGDRFANAVYARNRRNSDELSDNFLDNVIYHTGLLMGAQSRASGTNGSTVLNTAVSDLDLLNRVRNSDSDFYNDLNLGFNDISAETYESFAKAQSISNEVAFKAEQPPVEVMDNPLALGSDQDAKTVNQAIKEQVTDKVSALSTALSKAFSKNIETVANLEEVKLKKELAFRKAHETIAKLVGALQAQGLLSTKDQSLAFTKLAHLVQGSAKLNIGALNQLQQVYEQVQNKISAKAFDGLGLTQAQVNTYVSLLDGSAFVKGQFGQFIAADLTNPLLTVFIGLSRLDPNVKQALSTLKISLKAANGSENYDSTFNKWLSNVGNGLSNLVLGSYRLNAKNKDAQTYVDTLLNQLQNPKQQSELVQTSARIANKIANQVNNGCVQVIDTVVDAGANMLKHLADKTSIEGIKSLLDSASTILSLYDTDNTDTLLKTVSKHNVFNPIRDALKDLVGRNSVTDAFYTINKQVKAMVQGVRERCSKVIPSHFDQIFTKELGRKLTRQEHQALYKAYGAFDLTALDNPQAIKDVLDPKSRTAAITNLEQSLYNALTTYFKNQGQNAPKTLARDSLNFIKLKSKQLARYLNTGIPGDCLLKNPFAILNSGVEKFFKLSGKDSKVLKDLDQLISLYALDLAEPSMLIALNGLLNQAPLGMQGTVNFLKELRKHSLDAYFDNAVFNDDALVDVHNAAQLFNYRKGFLPASYQDSSSIVLDKVTPENLKYYKSLGYEFKQQAAIDKSLGYFYRSFDPTSTYNQGALQVIHNYGLGVDNTTGYVIAPVSYKELDYRQARELYGKRRNFFNNAKDNYAPIFNSNGSIIGMEVIPDAEMLKLKPQSEDLLTAIGMMYSRNQEQKLAAIFNKQLISNLVEMYDQASSSDQSELYEDITASSDPIVRDSMNQLPHELRQALFTEFKNRGYQGVFVRRDLINDILGERQASLTDPFTGVSRLNPKTQKLFRDVATAILGDKALKYLTYTDKNIKNLASIARNTIVIKSIQVAYGNIISNEIFLMMSGISPVYIYKKSLQAYRELEWYNKTQREITKLYTIYHSLNENSPERAKILAKITARNAHKRQLSIYPLIQAGEYNTIADIGTQYSDKALDLGKFSDYLEHQAKKLPQSIRTLSSSVFLTQDSPIYQGLQKATQYGDFIAKAVLYQHLLEKGVTEQQAHIQVADAFVDYDRQRGRWRGALEDFGLLWFWNFKLRSTKHALYLLKYHPLASLMYFGSPIDATAESLLHVDIGSPLTDNAVSAVARGNFATVGPGMYSNIVTSNPWLNLMY